jgi:hypothetical protein
LFVFFLEPFGSDDDDDDDAFRFSFLSTPAILRAGRQMNLFLFEQYFKKIPFF